MFEALVLWRSSLVARHDTIFVGLALARQIQLMEALVELKFDLLVITISSTYSTLQPAYLTRGQDDHAEIWFYKGISDWAEYSLYFRLKKIPCRIKDQVRACHSGEICGLTRLARQANSILTNSNAVHANARFGLSLYFNRLGTSRITQLGVAALDKGWPLPANRALICAILDVLCAA